MFLHMHVPSQEYKMVVKTCRFVSPVREYSSLIFWRLKEEKGTAMKKETEREREKETEKMN